PGDPPRGPRAGVEDPGCAFPRRRRLHHEDRDFPIAPRSARRGELRRGLDVAQPDPQDHGATLPLYGARGGSPVGRDTRPAPDGRGRSLVRGIGLLDATTIVVGWMIGSGIFIVSAKSARVLGSGGWLLAAWAIAGVLTMVAALCCSELAAMI